MCGFSKCRSDTEGKEQLPNRIAGMSTQLVATKTAQIFTAVISLAHRKMTNHDCKYFGRLHYTLKATREPRKCYVTGHNAASRNPSPPELKRATTAAGTIKAIRLHLGVYGGQKGLWGISRCVCVYTLSYCQTSIPGYWTWAWRYPSVIVHPIVLQHYRFFHKHDYLTCFKQHGSLRHGYRFGLSRLSLRQPLYSHVHPTHDLMAGKFDRRSYIKVCMQISKALE